MLPSVSVIAAEEDTGGGKFGTNDLTNIIYVKPAYSATPAGVSISTPQPDDHINDYPALMTIVDGTTFAASEAAPPDTTPTTLEFSWIIAGPILGIVVFLAVFLSLLAKGKIGQKK